MDADLQATAALCDNSVIYPVPLPGVEPGLRPSQGRVHPPHSKDKLMFPFQRENDIRSQIIRHRA